MGLQKIVVLCLIAVVIIAGGWYFVANKNSNGTSDMEGQRDDKESTSSLESNIETGIGSLMDLISLERSLSCTFRYTDEAAGDISGVVYIDRDRMRGDFDIEHEGEPFQSHMINDGVMVYTWTTSREGTFATKYSIETDDTADADDTEEAHMFNNDTLPFDEDDNVSYECMAWKVDNTQFIPPGNIEFQDMSAMFNGSMDVDASASACAMCEQVPAGEARTQCKAALGCQ